MSHALAWLRFETALGVAAIAWSEAGICAAQLPEQDGEATALRMRERLPAVTEAQAGIAPPPMVQRAIEGLRALLAGRSLDLLLDVPLDERGLPEFRRRVHLLTRQIPVGQTRSYGELAAELGQPGAARAVGLAQGQNPFAPIVPCHRVLGAGGALTGFSAHGGLQTKQRLLLIEARAAGQLGGEQQALF